MVDTGYYVERVVFLCIFVTMTVLSIAQYFNSFHKQDPRWSMRWVGLRGVPFACTMLLIFSIDMSGAFGILPIGVRFELFVNFVNMQFLLAMSTAYNVMKVNFTVLRKHLPITIKYGFLAATVFTVVGGNLTFGIGLILHQVPLVGVFGLICGFSVLYVYLAYIIALRGVLKDVQTAQSQVSQSVTRAMEALIKLRRGWIIVGGFIICFACWTASTLTHPDGWVPDPESYDPRYAVMCALTALQITLRMWYVWSPFCEKEGPTLSKRSSASNINQAPPSPTSKPSDNRASLISTGSRESPKTAVVTLATGGHGAPTHSHHVTLSSDAVKDPTSEPSVSATPPAAGEVSPNPAGEVSPNPAIIEPTVDDVPVTISE